MKKFLGYRIDSRQVGAGDLFFAIRGEKVDGHDFLSEVAAKGAVAAVVHTSYIGPDFGLELIYVDDVGGYLREMARQDLEERPTRVVGVTGSVGKTTTKDFIATLLGGRFKVGKTQGNQNTKLTMPLTILNRVGDEEVMVLEMGMTEPGDIGRVVEIAKPEIAVVTKIAWMHGANFPGKIEQIAYEKAAIFKGASLAIFPQELEKYKSAMSRMQGRKVSFSSEVPADYFLSEGGFIDVKGVRAHHLDVRFKLPHVLHNLCAAIAVAREMKLSWEEIEKEMPKLELPKMRFEQFEKEGITFINDAYNAGPDSMRAALSSMPEPQSGGKKIAVLGQMVQLGEKSMEIHAEVGKFASIHVDHLIVFGKEAEAIFTSFSESKKPADHYVSLHAVTERLKKLVRPGDVVLVKASRAVGLERVLDAALSS